MDSLTQADPVDLRAIRSCGKGACLDLTHACLITEVLREAPAQRWLEGPNAQRAIFDVYYRSTLSEEWTRGKAAQELALGCK